MTQWHLNLRYPYFDLVQQGRKTIEVRVKYEHLQGMAPGDTIEFCRGEPGLTHTVGVVRVTEYPSIAALLDAEPLGAINPDATRAQQEQAIRAIYTPMQEALGVLAIEITGLP